MRTVSLIVAGLFMASASVAQAGVGPYQWGMPLQEVVQIGDGDLHEVRGGPGDRVFGSDLRAEGTYGAAGLIFRGEFYFDPADRLSGVRLHAEKSDCNQLFELLEGLYGLGSPTGAGRVWIDTAANNEVRFTSFDGDCFVAYSPVSRGGGLGL